jgi:hypothetical protein
LQRGFHVVPQFGAAVRVATGRLAGFIKRRRLNSLVAEIDRGNDVAMPLLYQPVISNRTKPSIRWWSRRDQRGA